MEMFRNAMPTNSLAPSVSTLDQKRLEQAFKEIQSLAGVLTNKEQDMLSQANDPITLLTTLRDIKQNLRSSGRLMSDTDKEIAMNAMPSNPMQPLVEMGFGEQVDIILGNPADSDISRQAQQQIINEMGTGMDIDSFLMEVNNLAPKGAMTEY
jgi:UDP-N-acetylmuramate-alanine ligase